MSKIEELEFDVEILRDEVYQIEQNIKALTDDLARVKELLQETMRTHGVPRPVSKSQYH